MADIYSLVAAFGRGSYLGNFKGPTLAMITVTIAAMFILWQKENRGEVTP